MIVHLQSGWLIYLSMHINHLHIVLADDDFDDRLLFEDVFNQVRMAHTLHMVNGGEALMHYLDTTEQLPNIIFLDLNMPIKSGKDCLAEIRADPKFREVAVVIYTTSGLIKDIEDTFIAGANVFIKKPTDFLALKKILADVFGISRLYLTDGLNRENFMMSFLDDPKPRTPAIDSSKIPPAVE